MRKPASIRAWLSPEDLQTWVRQGRGRDQYQRRLAIWLTHIGPFPAHRVATLLGVSKQAVWAWVSQYNRHGPQGLERQGRGGRRWGYLSWEDEQDFLASLRERAQQGQILTARQIHRRRKRSLRKPPGHPRKSDRPAAGRLARAPALSRRSTRFGRLSDRRRCWAPWPSRPRVGHQVIREYIYAPWRHSVPPTADSPHSCSLLGGCRNQVDFPDQYCIMLLDGAGWHRATDPLPDTVDRFAVLRPRTQSGRTSVGPSRRKRFWQPGAYSGAR